MRILFLALLWTLLMAAGACSLVVDTSTTQCRSDQDCVRFGAVCDREERVCVSASPAIMESPDAGIEDTQSDQAGSSCLGPGGCYACPPTNDEQLASLCTDSICIPFDNARVTLLTPDGRLRPLP